MFVHLTVLILLFHSIPKASQDLSKPCVVKHSTNGFDVKQKPSSTSIRTATTETRTPPSTTTGTRTDEPKITLSLSSQPISKSTDGKSAAGQKTSNLVNVRSQNIVKNESHGIKRASGSFRDPEKVPEASRLESSRDARQQTRESKVDMLETLPSFDSQPQSREVAQGEKVTFRCQGEYSELKWLGSNIELAGYLNRDLLLSKSLHSSSSSHVCSYSFCSARRMRLYEFPCKKCAKFYWISNTITFKYILNYCFNNLKN